MYKKLSKITALVFCTIALIGTVLAVDTAPDTTFISTSETTQPITLWGQLTWTEDGTFMLDNNSLNDSWVIHTAQALFIDATTGTALDAERLRDGDTVYVYTTNATTLVVGNIPMGFGVPTYYVIDSEVIISQNYFTFTAGDNTVTISRDMTLETYDSEELLCPAALGAGTQVLVWRDLSGTTSRLMVVNP